MHRDGWIIFFLLNDYSAFIFNTCKYPRPFLHIVAEFLYTENLSFVGLHMVGHFNRNLLLHEAMKHQLYFLHNQQKYNNMTVGQK